MLGFSGVLLLRNSLRYRHRRLVVFSRGMGWLCCGLSFYGFLTTYLYVNFLRGEGAQLPLAASIAAWVLGAPWVIMQGRYLSSTTRDILPKWWALPYCIAYILALLGADAGMPHREAAFWALSSCMICVGCLIFLWRWMNSGELKFARMVVLLGVSCYPVVLLAKASGLGDVLAQFLLNVLIAVFALAMLWLCRSWNLMTR